MTQSFFFNLPQNLVLHILDEWISCAKDFRNFDSAVANRACRWIYLDQIAGKVTRLENAREVSFQNSLQLAGFKLWAERRNVAGLFRALCFGYPESLLFPSSGIALTDPVFWTTIRSLSLSNTKLSVFQTFALLKLQTLRTLKLTDIKIYHRTINTLNMSHANTVIDPQPTEPPLPHPNIYTLSLSEVISPNYVDVIQTLCAACPNTKTLTIVLCTNCTSLTLVRHILPSMPMVEELVFSSLVGTGDVYGEWRGNPFVRFAPAPFPNVDQVRVEELRRAVDRDGQQRTFEEEDRRAFRDVLSTVRGKCEERANRLCRANEQSRIYPKLSINRVFPNIKKLHVLHPPLPSPIHYYKIHRSDQQLQTRPVRYTSEYVDKVNVEDMFYLLPSMIALEELQLDLSYALSPEQLMVTKWEEWLHERHLHSSSIPFRRCEIGYPIFRSSEMDTSIATMIRSLRQSMIPILNFSLKQDDQKSHPMRIWKALLEAEFDHTKTFQVNDPTPLLHSEPVAEYVIQIASLALDITTIASFETFHYHTVNPQRVRFLIRQQDPSTSYHISTGVRLFASFHTFDDVYYPLHHLRVLSIELVQVLYIPYTINSRLVASLLTLTMHLFSAHSSLPVPLIESIHLAAPHISFRSPSAKNSYNNVQEEDHLLDEYREMSTSMIPYRWRCQCPHLRSCHINIPYYFTQLDTMEELILPRIKKHCAYMESLHLQLSVAKDDLIQFVSKNSWDEYWENRHEHEKPKDHHVSSGQEDSRVNNSNLDELNYDEMEIDETELYVYDTEQEDEFSNESVTTEEEEEEAHESI